MRIILRAAAVLVLVFSAGGAATVRLGATSSKLLLDPQEGDANFRPNVHVSILRDFPLTFGALFAGLGYEGRGNVLETRLSASGDTFEGRSETVRTYITLPVGIRFENRRKIQTRGYLALGLAPSILLESEESYSERTTINGVLEEGRQFYYQRDNTAPFDLVTEAEAGLSFPVGNLVGGRPSRFLLGIGIGYGLIDVNDPEDEEALKAQAEAQGVEYTHVKMHSLIVRVCGGISF